MEAYSKIVSNQLSDLPIFMNLSEIFRNSTLEVTDWISQENYTLKKAQINLSMNMTRQSLGIAPEGPKNQKIRQLTNTTLIFQDYNKPVNIKLPAEANAAMKLTTI